MKASGKEPARTLTTADLCHSCPARAVVETVMVQGRSLLWCAHHFALFENALKALGATLRVDERCRADPLEDDAGWWIRRRRPQTDDHAAAGVSRGR